MQSITIVNDGLVEFPAPGPSRPAGEPIPPRPADGPAIQLVDFDGTPIEAPVRPAALSWPAWTDLVRVRTGGTDEELERHRLSCGIGDTLAGIVWRADNLGPPVDAYEEGPGAMPMNLAPIAGGAPGYEEYDPTPEDEADYRAWLERTDGGTLPDELPHNPRLDVGVLAAVSDALYGPGTPTAAR